MVNCEAIADANREEKVPHQPNNTARYTPLSWPPLHNAVSVT